MKKIILFLCLSFSMMQLANANAQDVANIKIKIEGAISDNRYFLCLPNTGCLSILAAERGKIYSFSHAFEIPKIYMTNVQNFKVYSQDTPSSCNVTVNTNQTLTISGKIVSNNKSVNIKNLHCSLN